MVFYAVLAGKFWSVFGYLMTKASAMGEGSLLVTCFLMLVPLVFLLKSVWLRKFGFASSINTPVELPQALSDWLSRALLNSLCLKSGVRVGDVRSRVIIVKNRWVFSVFMAKLYNRGEDMMLVAELECLGKAHMQSYDNTHI